MTHRYRIKRWGSARFGALCRVLRTARNGSILIEFEDGFRMVTTRYGVRKEQP